MSKLGDITVTKQTGTILTLATAGKYVSSDVSFDIGVQSGAGTVTVASTDVTIQSDITGRNISGIIGAKSSTAPSSGFYLKLDASGTGSSAITTAGWLDVGTIGTSTASGTFYFPVTSANGYGTMTGENTVTPSASISGTNVTLTNVDNGISVTATGGGTASAYVSASASATGYVTSGSLMANGYFDASSAATSASQFISGVTLTVPASGYRTFSITVPNGQSTSTFTYKVDSSGNVTISDGGNGTVVVDIP